MLSSAVNQLCRQCRHQLVSLPVWCSRAVVPRPTQAGVELRSWLLNTPVRFAGHSHWQNIKKIKAEKDDLKQKAINTVVLRIRTAVRGWCCICVIYRIIHNYCFLAFIVVQTHITE